jgi:hypothetical protein
LHSTKYHPIFDPELNEKQNQVKICAMNIENTQSQMRKGILEFCILSIIRRGEAYPSDIVEEMRAANLQILEGTLYPLLTRLKNAEMLTYRWVESNSGNIFRSQKKANSSTTNWSKPGTNCQMELMR